MPDSEASEEAAKIADAIKEALKDTFDDSDSMGDSDDSDSMEDSMEEVNTPVRPFDYINKTDPAHLLNFIHFEHPQTIALVLAYLEPNKASVILESLPHDIQSEVAYRIATMDRVSPEVRREVERVLEKKLSTFSSEDYSAAGGIESIVEILNMVDRASRKQIIEALEAEDPELAEEIKERMLPWMFRKLSKLMSFFKRCKLWRDNKLPSMLPKDVENTREHMINQLINQFSTAINAQETEPEVFKPAANTRKIKIYDFRRPDKFSRQQVRTVSVMHETFARLTTNSLAAQLRSMVHVQVASVDQLLYGEFTRSIPTPTTLAIINMDPLEGNAVLEIDPAVTFSIIDRLLGGVGEGKKLQHELTDIEIGIMEGVIVRMLGNMREAWTQVLDLRPRLCQIETNPQFAEIVPPTDMVLLITLETKVGDVEGMINFCIPYITVEPIIGKLSAQFWFSVTPSVKSGLFNYCRDMPVPVKLTAEILRRDYPLEEIKDWKEGTNILPLCPLTPNHCYLRLGDRRVWECEMLEDEKSYPKKVVIVGQAKMPFGTEDKRMEINKVNPVTSALMKAKMLVTVELGATAKTVSEVFSIGDGTILELDKLAGEPLDVKANGVLIAKGEAVVVDENFGVRITETIGTPNPWEKQETPAAESQEQGL